VHCVFKDEILITLKEKTLCAEGARFFDILSVKICRGQVIDHLTESFYFIFSKKFSYLFIFSLFKITGED